MRSRGQVDLEGSADKDARLKVTVVLLAKIRSSGSPSAPLYIRGGAEAFRVVQVTNIERRIGPFLF